MVNQKFNDWVALNYKRLAKSLAVKYPKSKSSIDNDLTDVYEQIILKGPENIVNWEAWIYQFVFNRHYRFYTKRKPEVEYIELNHQIAEEEYDHKHDQLVERIQLLIKELPIDYQNLYDLHYVQGLSGREIGNRLGLHYTGIYKQLRNLKTKIKNKL